MAVAVVLAGETSETLKYNSKAVAVDPVAVDPVAVVLADTSSQLVCALNLQIAWLYSRSH